MGGSLQKILFRWRAIGISGGVSASSDPTGLEAAMARPTRRPTILSCFVVTAACTVLVVPADRQAALAQAGERYEIAATHDVMVAARDGVRLATDVYLPGKGGTTTGRFPTIVERTPYNKASAANELVPYF